MTLTIDVGNSNLTGGVFCDEKMVLQFRKTTHKDASSDEIGIFLRSVLRENQIDPSKITKIGVCSVVPPINYSLASGISKYFGKEPLFIQSGIKTGLKLKVPNPKEVGADLIADSIGASSLFPDRNLIIVDLGTASTINLVTKDKVFLGGAILPGLKMSVQALADGTSKLPHVEISRPKEPLGVATVDAIQSGIFYGHAGSIKELCGIFKKEYFKDSAPLVIGTGGFAKIFEDCGIFDRIVPALTLIGVKKAIQLNEQS